MKRCLTFAAIFLLNSIFLIYGACADEVLTWQDCVKEAAKNHPDLISAQEAVKQSEAAKRVTVSALFPQINATADATRTKTPGSNGSRGTTSNNYSYGANGTQLIFDGIKTINNVNAAKENIKAAQYNYKFTSAAVRLRLRTAFIDLLKAQEALKITDDIAKIRKRNLDLITLRYQSGMEHRGALLTAQANMAQANFEIAQARRNMRSVQRELVREMGRGEFSSVLVKADFAVKDSSRERPDFEEIAKNSPSLLELIAKINQASYSLKATYGNFLPQITGQAGVDRTDSRWPPQNKGWNLGLGVSLPIFEGGLRTAEVAQAEAILHQARANERSGRDAVVVALEQAWASLQDSIETVDVQRQFLTANEERAKIAEAQYSTGFITYDNWTIIEDNLVSAKSQYLNAQANALLAEANWIQAKGEILEYAE